MPSSLHGEPDEAAFAPSSVHKVAHGYSSVQLTAHTVGVLAHPRHPHPSHLAYLVSTSPPVPIIPRKRVYTDRLRDPLYWVPAVLLAYALLRSFSIPHVLRAGRC